MKYSAVGEYRSWRSVLDDLLPFSGWTVFGFWQRKDKNLEIRIPTFQHGVPSRWKLCWMAVLFPLICSACYFACIQERTLLALTAPFFGFVLDTIGWVPSVTSWIRSLFLQVLMTRRLLLVTRWTWSFRGFAK